MSNSTTALAPCLNFETGPAETNHQELLSDDGQDFRLLQIEPAKESTAPIIARLFKASLINTPQYEAISYRWETTGNLRSITVNGAKLSVTQNVFSLLSELRRQSFSSTTLWIDSICIDQNSIEERNNQVQLMGEIYSKASVVIVWLGTEADNADKAFALIRRCDPGFSEKFIVENSLRDEVGTKALTELLRRPYWNRMWVFQEIVLAEEAVVCCGTLKAPWSNFRRLDEVSSRHALWRTAQRDLPWILDLRKALFTIAHCCIKVDQALFINNVLHPTRHLQCQDPRDKLYALLGVCKTLRRNVTPDYSMPVREVFTAFAQSQILEDRNLSTVLTAGLWSPLNGTDISLPSWVPDLRGMGGVGIRYLAGSYMKLFDADGSAFYQDGYSLTQDIFFHRDGNSLLKVSAIKPQAFSVQYKCPLLGITHSKYCRKAIITAICLSSDGVSGLSTVRLRQLFEALIFGDRVMLTHDDSTDSNLPERTKRLALGFYQDLCQLFSSDPVFPKLVQSSEDIIGAYGIGVQAACFRDPGQLLLYQREYLSRAEETTERQTTEVFLTIGGRLGIGPLGIQPDDFIAIVQGCRVPLALRKQRNVYRLVGPVYVAGIMQGEVVQGAGKLDSDVSFEDIDLM